MSRPELTGHASTFYNEKEARKYNSSSRMIGVQREITERAIELLRLPNCHKDSDEIPSLVLDIGCGSGLSGQVLEEYGHIWLGCDISLDMLTVAKERMNAPSSNNNGKKERHNSRMDTDDDSDGDDDSDNDNNDSEDSSNDDDEIPSSLGDLMQHDMGTGLPFRPATFDACISISALQWLCYSTTKAQLPKKRLQRFFSSLYVVLKRTGRAVLQFYPETAEQAVLISEVATSCGFTGGVVVDYPNSAKAKKHYLVLSFDKSHAQKKGMIDATPQTKEQKQQTSVTTISNNNNTHRNKKNNKEKPIRKKKGMKTKEWILHKKEGDRKRGKQVRPDTKYTARKRPTRF